MPENAIKNQRNTAIQVLRVAACMLVLVVHVGQRRSIFRYGLLCQFERLKPVT